MVLEGVCITELTSDSLVSSSVQLTVRPTGLATSVSC